jgi:hypothetical protein
MANRRPDPKCFGVGFEYCETTDEPFRRTEFEFVNETTFRVPDFDAAIAGQCALILDGGVLYCDSWYVVGDLIKLKHHTITPTSKIELTSEID